MNNASDKNSLLNLSVNELLGRYSSNINNYDERLERICDGLIGSNKFITEFNFAQKKYVFYDNLETCLGYSPEEFTVEMLNNYVPDVGPRTHEEDIQHKRRYDFITFKLVSRPYEFEALRDYYKLNFRIYHKNGEVLKAEKSSFLFRLKQQRPISQIDLWEISRNPCPHVIPAFYTPNYGDIMRDFYQLNEHILGIQFTPRQLEVLAAKKANKTNSEIADEMKLSSARTIEKHIENIIKRVNKFHQDNGSQKVTYSISEVVDFAQIYGLLPYYS